MLLRNSGEYYGVYAFINNLMAAINKYKGETRSLKRLKAEDDIALTYQKSIDVENLNFNIAI